MALVIMFTVHCDVKGVGCHGWASGDQHRAQATQNARDAGWVRYRDDQMKWACPKCADLAPPTT